MATIREIQRERIQAAKKLIPGGKLSKFEISELTGCPISAITRLRREMHVKLPRYHGPNSHKAVLEGLIAQGLRNSEIAVKLGISKQAVSDAIQYHGLNQTGGRCPKEELIAMIKAGDKCTKEIARLSGYCLSSVRLAAENEGVTLPPNPVNPLKAAIRS